MRNSNVQKQIQINRWFTLLWHVWLNLNPITISIFAFGLTFSANLENLLESFGHFSNIWPFYTTSLSSLHHSVSTQQNPISFPQKIQLVFHKKITLQSVSTHSTHSINQYPTKSLSTNQYHHNITLHQTVSNQ